MLMMLLTLACETQPKSYFYDISSTVMVTDETGLTLDLEEIELCQRFRSEDYDTTTSWTVHAEQCEVVDIKDGVATLSNWEGEYFGPDVSIVIDLSKDGDVYEAELLDNDTEVWCDNAVVTEIDEHGNPVTYDDLCSENYERYLLWSLVLPSELF